MATVDECKEKVKRWEYIVEAHKLTLEHFDPPRDGDDLQAFKDINKGYKRAMDRLEKARQKLREVEDSE